MVLFAVAQGFQNLANLYYRQGDYDQAEALYKRAISMKEQSLGREHPGMSQCHLCVDLMLSPQILLICCRL